MPWWVAIQLVDFHPLSILNHKTSDFRSLISAFLACSYCCMAFYIKIPINLKMRNMQGKGRRVQNAHLRFFKKQNKTKN